MNISISVHWYSDRSVGDRFCRGNIYGVDSDADFRIVIDDDI